MSDTTTGGNTMHKVTQQARQIWECTKIDDEYIYFSVLNETTEEAHEERQTRDGFALMFALGGNTPAMATMLTIQGPGFRFRKEPNGQIYIDGPSIGEDDYHPISRPSHPATTPPASDGDAADTIGE